MQYHHLLSTMYLSPTEIDICDIRAYNSAIYSQKIIVYTCITRFRLRQTPYVIMQVRVGKARPKLFIRLKCRQWHKWRIDY